MHRWGVLLVGVVLGVVVEGQEVAVENKVVGTLSETLYSTFFETEINFGSEGGLYAELVRNRDFETLGRGNVGAGRGRGAQRWEGKPPPPDETSYAPWETTGGATGRVTNRTAPFATNPHVLELTTAGDGSGVRNPGYWGMWVRGGMEYKVSLYARRGGGGTGGVGEEEGEGEGKG
eukprot:Sspe_Gene.90551::Locus_62077_Transcript_1_1_Confidence_1.000_Length_710::g.90551::m.90551